MNNKNDNRVDKKCDVKWEIDRGSANNLPVSRQQAWLIRKAILGFAFYIAFYCLRGLNQLINY